MRQLAFVVQNRVSLMYEFELSQSSACRLTHEAPDVVRMSVAQRHHVDRCGVNARAPEIGEQAAAARPYTLRNPIPVSIRTSFSRY